MKCSKYGLLTEPSLFDFLHEKLITLVPFSIALFALFKYSNNLLWPLLYIGIIVLHMIHILLKRCPHCVYYKTGSKWHSCLWWRWVPKVKNEKEGPAPKYIGIYTPIALLIITFYPIYWLKFQWELLTFYIFSWCVLALSIYTAGCARCIDFDCKNNAVSKELQEEYLTSLKKNSDESQQ